jgi:hypothetical protein
VATLQLLLPLPAKIVFFSTGSLPAVTRRRPAPVAAELLLIVTFVRLRMIPAVPVEDWRMPPPAPLGWVTALSETVTLVSVALWRLFRPPPYNPCATFPRTRLPLRTRTPPIALWIPPPSLPETLFGPIVLLLIVSVPTLLMPPPVVAAVLSEITELFSVVLDPVPVLRPPPLPPAPAVAVPFRIVTPDIVTAVVFALTFRTRSTSAPSMIVAPAPAPLIVTDPLVMSRSPVAALGDPPESVPAMLSV